MGKEKKKKSTVAGKKEGTMFYCQHEEEKGRGTRGSTRKFKGGGGRRFRQKDGKGNVRLKKRKRKEKTIISGKGKGESLFHPPYTPGRGQYHCA